MSLKELWSLWTLEGKVKTMDTKALIKLAVCGLMAAVATGGAQYVGSDHVNLSAILSAVIASVVAYVQNPPHK